MIKINSKILGIIVLSTIFGLGAGMVGTLLTRVYILEESFNVPFYGEIDLSGPQYTGSSLVISNPKKVVVEQNTKITETAKAAEKNIVGIFAKKTKTESLEEKKFDINNYYSFNEEIAQGLIITSDGWIISNYIPRELKNVSPQSEEVFTRAKEKVIATNVIISGDEKVYEIDDIVIDDLSSISFWHVNENDFSVKKFVTKEEISNGQLIIGVDWNKNVILSSISNINKISTELVQNSDDFMEEIILSEKKGLEVNNSFFFDLNGDLVALTDVTGKIIPVYSYLPCINCLLGDKVVSRPSLGLNYIDLSKLISDNSKELSDGALISKNIHGISLVKNGAAELAGLKEGDIVISVNGVVLDENKDLSQIISKFRAEEEISIVYERNNESRLITVKLGKL